MKKLIGNPYGLIAALDMYLAILDKLLKEGKDNG